MRPHVCRRLLALVTFATMQGMFAPAAETPSGVSPDPARMAEASGPPPGTALIIQRETPPPLPEGYELLYEQEFKDSDSFKDFVMTDPKAWKYSWKKGRGTLELLGQSDYAPPHRSPVNIALLADWSFEDFILEASLIQTGREYGHRDMCLFFGFQDPSKFYYVHIATEADDHAHNVFLVNDAPRTKIARMTTQGVDWGLGVWHTVRVERVASEGSIRVYFDDMSLPIMEAEDKTFAAGQIGFGSFDDTGKVTDIRIWGPKMLEQKLDPFGNPATSDQSDRSERTPDSVPVPSDPEPTDSSSPE